MVLIVCLGAVLGAVGIYEPFMEYAGAGASVPLLGFGNVLWKGVKEAVDANGFLGLFQGGFKSKCRRNFRSIDLLAIWHPGCFRAENEKIVHIPEYV